MSWYNHKDSSIEEFVNNSKRLATFKYMYIFDNWHLRNGFLYSKAKRRLFSKSFNSEHIFLFSQSCAEGSTEERNEIKKKEHDEDRTGLSQYQEACKSLGIVPIRKVSEQLREHEMSLPHIGMNSLDCQALACALWVSELRPSPDILNTDISNYSLKKKNRI